MKMHPTDPPREFEVGRHVSIRIKDCGRLDLEPDEQVTLRTPAGAEYDVARKDWGFYATPSINARLERFGLKAVLIKNLEGRYFVVLVEKGRDREFDAYVKAEELKVIAALDQAALERIEEALA